MSDELTEEYLKEVEARANAATPGPWYRMLWNREEGGWLVIKGGEGERELICKDFRYDWPEELEHEADFTFIANARKDIPRLVAEVKRLRKLNIGPTN